MALTIDHLRPDHRVRVLRDFIDARGYAHSAESTGIVRRLGLEWAQRELGIRWERNGAPERLHFALDSTIGLGNGRMREYFELDADAPDTTAPAPREAKLEEEPPPAHHGPYLP